MHGVVAMIPLPRLKTLTTGKINELHVEILYDAPVAREAGHVLDDIYMPCTSKPSVRYPIAELVQQVYIKTWPHKHLAQRLRELQKLDSEVDSVV